MTINDLLADLDRIGASYTKIASGYYIGKTGTDILCKCDGNRRALSNECKRCGRVSFVCEGCLSTHEVYACNRCSYDLGQVFRRMREESNARLADDLGLSKDELDDVLRRIKERTEHDADDPEEPPKDAR